eukprot:Protomagalhaensia_wolfi_Nauph_80__5340@NODE_579_length_2261_cov_108_575608_g434_i0_p1_GENE_NODE_579_length_2261_cov_108_575608_g434_i0NODE_579_length_2261_cov_108_575608_g434_i0_p1_ORF_typecomplete_len347_score61_43Wbp11/PF09429_10/0_0066Wbp11/PF09429_10/1_8e04Cas_Cas1/PF01867_16/0_26AIM3/PF17096_5/9_3e02AIM3/PF17096_5/0_41SMC_N/PF02463_19/1_9Na_trans_assoc/PF06512_13/18_NODE_579_length_2261_cov_108_575608_g434_i0391079
MAKEGVNPVHASHRANKKKEKEKIRRDKLETRTLKQAGAEGSGVRQKLEDEIKKIRSLQGPKGRKRKLAPHMQMKLNQLEALAKQVKAKEELNAKMTVEMSRRNAVFEKAERINEGMDVDSDDEDDDGSVELDPLHASLSDKARAGILDIEALKEERRKRGERRGRDAPIEAQNSMFEFGGGDDGEDEDGSEPEGTDNYRRDEETNKMKDSDSESSSGSEIGDPSELPPPPPIGPPSVVNQVIPPPVPIPIPRLQPPEVPRPSRFSPSIPVPPLIPPGPISMVGFSDPRPIVFEAPPLVRLPVPTEPPRTITMSQPPPVPEPAPESAQPSWMMPASVVARLSKNKR